MRNRTKGIILLVLCVAMSFLPAWLCYAPHNWWRFVVYMWSLAATASLFGGALVLLIFGDDNANPSK